MVIISLKRTIILKLTAMKTKDSLLKQKVEHRGFDLSASKNFNLELQIVKEYNNPKQEKSSQYQKKSKSAR